MITTSMNQNIEATNKNTKKIFALKEQVASLEETSSLQSSQLEEIRTSQQESEKNFKKRIEELESSLSQQSSLINSQKLEIATTNSTLTETIKDIQDLKENSAELSHEAINCRVNDFLKQKDFKAHWQRELDKTAQKLVFKNLKRTPATANLHPLKVFEEHILEPMNISREDRATMTPVSVIDLNRNKPDFEFHLLLCSFSSSEGNSLVKRHATKLPRGVSFNL